MAEVKEKHPTWFKMKIERRQLVKQLEPKTAVNVLLACWDYLETGEYPTNLSALEQIAFSAFFPDMEEALKREARREYAREWRKRNPERVKATQERYWMRKAAEIAAKREKTSKNECLREGAEHDT